MFGKVLRSSRFGLASAGLLGLLALYGAPAHAQLVNGSFENGNFVSNAAAHSDQLFNGATDITGWTVVNEIAWLETGNPYGDAATDGSRVLDLTGYHDSQPEGGVQQTLALVVGNTYRLGLDVGYNPNFPSNPDGVTVTIAQAGVNQTFTVNTSGTGTTVGTNFFQHFTLNFTATQTTNTLLLQGSAASNGNNIGLDNVSLVNTTPAVTPEPGSVAMLIGLTMTGAGFLSRRRKVAKNAA